MLLSICLQRVMMCIHIQVLWKPEWIYNHSLIKMFLLQALFIGYLQNYQWKDSTLGHAEYKVL